MSKWVIIGSGGFVEGSLLPYIKHHLIQGIITHQPLKCLGLAKAYHLHLFQDLEDAKKAGCTTVYICSSTWTHFKYIKESIEKGFPRVICEKPIVTEESDMNDFITCAPFFYGMMLKRSHPHVRLLTQASRYQWEVAARAIPLENHDYIDLHHGGFLFNELIHFIDIALMWLGNDSRIIVEGNRIQGAIRVTGKSRSLSIRYNFDSDQEINDLRFTPRLIQSISRQPHRVIVPATQLIPLYKHMFEVKSQMMGVSVFDEENTN